MPISQIVTNSIANSVSVTFTAGSAAAPAITTTSDTNTGIFFPAADTIAFAEGGAEVMRIDSSGIVTVSNTSSAGRFVVASNAGTTITATNNFSSGQAYLSTNTAVASTAWNHFNGVSSNNTVQDILISGNGNIRNANNSYGTFSDVRLKENIVDTTPKLDDVLKLKVRNFNLIGEQENHKQIGFIAQEMEEVFPKLVDESTGIDGLIVKGIKTSVLIPILVKAIQEQQAIITDLKARIESLESN
jgi:hypothetical protein